MPFLAALGLLGVGAAGLTFMAMAADAGDRGFQKRRVAAEKLAARARELALLGVPPAGGTAVWENDPFFKAKRLFGERCAGCHVGNERKGPELLAGYNSRAWIQAFLKEPDSARFFGVTKGIHKMKPVKLQGDDLEAVVEMIYAETGARDAKAPVVARGKELFSQASCDDCHSLDGVTGGEEGPNLGGRGTVPWFTDMIADAKVPRLFGERNEMTRFGEKLTPAEIKALAAYVASLRDAKGDASDGAAAP